MENRTELRITPGVQQFAQAHGAYFDNDAKAWFVDGEVPGPLIAYMFQEERRRDYVSESFSPKCDCGSQMIIRRNRTTGDPFWACTTHRCRGTKNFDEVAGLVSVRSEQGRKNGRTETVEDKERVAALIARTIELFRNEGLATAWLNAPKVGLQGDTPLVAMRTLKGCIEVDRLLDERFD